MAPLECAILKNLHKCVEQFKRRSHYYMGVSLSLTYPKVFGTVQVRKDGEELLVEENPRLLPMRIVGNTVVIMAAGTAAIFFLLYRGAEDSMIGGASILVGLALLLVFGIAVIALVQLLVFVRFPITIDRKTQMVSRGNRIHLQGTLKAEIKGIGGGEGQKAFHVRLAEKKGKVMFVWRADSEAEAKEMAALINTFLRSDDSPSIASGEPRMNSSPSV